MLPEGTQQRSIQEDLKRMFNLVRTRCDKVLQLLP